MWGCEEGLGDWDEDEDGESGVSRIEVFGLEDGSEE